MVFLISYRKKFAPTKFQANLRKNFFAEHRDHPSLEEIKLLVDQVSRGEFAESSIEFQRCVGFDADELTKAGATVYRFSATGKAYASQ